ncbi:MAG: M28 family peptidase, partial [Bacteroidota bacterium]|nr:M28 family peptidase [Bacteroidota bacterium]
MAFGPRAPNSAGHDSCLAFFRSFLAPLADTVRFQPFEFPGYDRTRLRLTNVIASFHPQMKERILLAAHWDTRPWADREQDVKRSLQPVPGANDGASGVAVL